MAVFVDNLTVATTGTNLAVTGFGFNPTNLIVSVSGRGGLNTAMQYCYGMVDSSGTQCYDSIFADSTSRQSKAGSNKLISHYERIAGVLTEVINISFNSWVSGGFTWDVNLASSNYVIHLRATDS